MVDTCLFCLLMEVKMRLTVKVLFISCSTMLLRTSPSNCFCLTISWIVDDHILTWHEFWEVRLRLTPVTIIYIITSTYYNSTFDLFDGHLLFSKSHRFFFSGSAITKLISLFFENEIYKFGRKTEMMSLAPTRSTASSSSNRGHEVSVSCSERALSSAVLLLWGPVLYIDTNQQPGVVSTPSV